MFIIHFHCPLWYVRRSYQAPIKKLCYHPLLTCYPCHSSTYIFKLTLCNHDFIPSLYLMFSEVTGMM